MILAFEAIWHPAAWQFPPTAHLLNDLPWRWEIRNVAGELMADGEGCPTPEFAIATAKACARTEGWLPDDFSDVVFDEEAYEAGKDRAHYGG